MQLFVAQESHGRALALPASFQLASGALGVALAFAFVCPALGAACFGALGDARRYAGTPAGALWRAAFAALAVLAAASIAYPFATPHSVSGWPMLAFALLGLLVNSASVLAALPERLSAQHPFAMRASTAGYAMLAGAGAAGLLRPEGWICVVAVLATVPALAAEHLLDWRSKR